MIEHQRRNGSREWGTSKARFHGAVRRVADNAVRAGAAVYNRDRDLPALIRADPFSPMPDTAEGIRSVLARLERALRAERKRARAGHWTYDLNRHIALRQAYLAETERLAALPAAERPPNPGRQARASEAQTRGPGEVGVVALGPRVKPEGAKPQQGPTHDALALKPPSLRRPNAKPTFETTKPLRKAGRNDPKDHQERSGVEGAADA